jgi:tetratricopeptide (TPR) repeat protein
MTQNYGASFAQKLLDQGEYEQALVAAEREIARDADDPEPLVDRASVLTALERYADATRDLEKALQLDEEAQVLETDFVDDALFTALLGEARACAAQDLPRALERLGHYRRVFPKGRHLGDVDRWSAELRGEGDRAPIVKERDG